MPQIPVHRSVRYDGALPCAALIRYVTFNAGNLIPTYLTASNHAGGEEVPVETSRLFSRMVLKPCSLRRVGGTRAGLVGKPYPVRIER
jgi:hypothetical protein